jgi:predicted nucleotidyltransferase
MVSSIISWILAWDIAISSRRFSPVDCKKNRDVLTLYLFGSQAQGTAHRESYGDFAILATGYCDALPI